MKGKTAKKAERHTVSAPFFFVPSSPAEDAAHPRTLPDGVPLPGLGGCCQAVCRAGLL